MTTVTETALEEATLAWFAALGYAKAQGENSAPEGGHAGRESFGDAVRPEFQGFGIGKQLLQHVIVRARALGGTRLYWETSARPQDASTRAFYEHMGFILCEVLDDFYAPGDGRATYCARL